MRKKVMVSFIVCLAAVWSVFAEAQTITDGEMLSLEKAIEIALTNQPTIEAQQRQVQANEARVGQIRGGLLPHLSLGGGYTRITPVDAATGAATSNAGLPPGSQNIPTGSRDAYAQYAATGSINQLIFDFGKSWAQLRAQKTGVQAAKHDLMAMRDQVVLSVKEAYYSLLAANKSKDVSAEKVAQFKKHLEYARGLYKAGSRSKLDVTKAEVDLNNALLDAIKAENAVRYYRISLNNAMGLSRAPAYTVEEDLAKEPLMFAFELALQTAYSQRSDLLAMQMQKESAEQSLKASKRAHFPVVSGNVNYTFVGTDFPMDHGWTAGVYMSIPLFSGLTPSYKVAEDRANLLTIEARIRELKQKIALELEQDFLALREATERLGSAEVAVRQAKENLDLATERYAAGLAIAVEVADAIYSLANAQFGHISAHYDRKIALSRIDKAMGGRN